MTTIAPNRPAITLLDVGASPDERLQAMLEHLPGHEVITAQVNLDYLLYAVTQLAAAAPYLPMATILQAAMENLPPAF